MRSASMALNFPPSCRFMVSLPDAGIDAVFGDIATARAMSLMRTCTAPLSVPSGATVPLPSIDKMSAAEPRTVN